MMTKQQVEAVAPTVFGPHVLPFYATFAVFHVQARETGATFHHRGVVTVKALDKLDKPRPKLSAAMKRHREWQQGKR